MLWPSLVPWTVRFGDITHTTDPGSKFDTGSKAAIMRKCTFYQVLSLVCWGIGSTLLCTSIQCWIICVPCSSLKWLQTDLRGSQIIPSELLKYSCASPKSSDNFGFPCSPQISSGFCLRQYCHANLQSPLNFNSVNIPVVCSLRGSS